MILLQTVISSLKRSLAHLAKMKPDLRRHAELDALFQKEQMRDAALRRSLTF